MSYIRNRAQVFEKQTLEINKINKKSTLKERFPVFQGSKEAFNFSALVSF